MENLHIEDKNKFIGVFDSGMGGISTLIELKKIMPNENFYYFGDCQNAPYGPKTPEEILTLSLNVSDFLYKQNIKAIVVACNTATSVAINALRDKYKDIPIIGVEPAVKLGVDSGGKNILVMATQTTVSQSKFKHLTEKFKDTSNIYAIACPELVQIVENDLLKDKTLCKEQLMSYFYDFDMDNIDTIVLGCTHFIFYKKYIREIFGNKHNIVDGNLGTALHLKNELSKRNLINDNNNYDGKIIFMNSQIVDENTKIRKKELSEKLFHTFYEYD